MCKGLEENWGPGKGRRSPLPLNSQQPYAEPPPPRSFRPAPYPPRSLGASAFNVTNEQLQAGLAKIQHGEEMRAVIKDKEEGWESWLVRAGLWGEDRGIEGNYLRYR